jgi:hypothetical protein
MEVRLLKLSRNDYLAYPDLEHRKTKPIPEPICWLGWRGVHHIAGLYGVKVPKPKSNNEYQLRLFQKDLREQGIRWVRRPRWSTLKHDLTLVDIRFAFERSSVEAANLRIENWLYEGEFRSDMDVVEFRHTGRDGEVNYEKRGVCPDAYFEIVDDDRLRRGFPSRARFLIELDMASHDNPSFGRYKALPYSYYIRSSAYRSRFGANNGRWLIITSGQETRLSNLKRQTKEKAGDEAKLFYYTLLNNVYSEDILNSPVWTTVTNDPPFSLLSSH